MDIHLSSNSIGSFQQTHFAGLYFTEHLKRNEDIPNIKTSIRLLNHIFFLALDIPEYQRQLATPNVPKYSTALLNLAEKTENQELQVHSTL